MIGQKGLINRIDKLIEQKIFPQFAIIVGQRGSGKKTLCSELFQKLNVFACFEPDNKVETVRNVIIDAYKVGSPACYVFADVDDMSVQAKNALLKIVEEPPKNAYFIMTVNDISTVLPTILSRATTFYMQPYSKDELLEYGKPTVDADIVTDICATPGDIDLLYSMGVDEFYSYVEKVVDNIAYVGTSNVFKLTEKIALKPEAKGYDLRLFLIAFERVCTKELMKCLSDKDDRDYWIDGIKIASDTLSVLQAVTGINKSALLDTFIIKIRKVWS